MKTRAAFQQVGGRKAIFKILVCQQLFTGCINQNFFLFIIISNLAVMIDKKKWRAKTLLLLLAHKTHGKGEKTLPRLKAHNLHFLKTPFKCRMPYFLPKCSLWSRHSWRVWKFSLEIYLPLHSHVCLLVNKLSCVDGPHSQESVHKMLAYYGLSSLGCICRTFTKSDGMRYPVISWYNC